MKFSIRRFAAPSLVASAIATALAIAAFAALGYRVLGIGLREVSDEGFHAPQIWMLFVGKYQILDAITVFPTYHAFMALVERIAGYHSVELIRFVNLLGSLFLPILVWRLVAMHAPQESARRTVQWFVMPLLFPFFFLIYTDAWALVAVLATILFALGGRIFLAACAGLIAALLRQDMIIWVGLAWMLVVLGSGDFSRWRQTWREELLPSLARGLPLLTVLLLFGIFFLWNRGVAVGDRSRHAVTFNFTSIAFFLLCAWLVFLPQNLAAVPRIWRLLQRPACLILLVAGFALYMGTYLNEHEYNGPNFRFFLRNEALYWLTHHTWIRAMAFLPMAWMVMTFCVTRLAQPRLRLLYLVAPLAIGLHPLIEQRYYLPALTLFQVWRSPAGDRWEYGTLLLYLAITPVIVWGIAYRRFFL